MVKSIHLTRILVVEPKRMARLTVCDILTENGFLAQEAETLDEARSLIGGETPSLVLLNPEHGDNPEPGFLFTEELRNNQATALLPIVYLTSLRDPKSRRRAFASGAADFIAKPFEEFELLQRLQRHIRLYHLDLEKLQEKARLQRIVADRTAEIRMANQRLEALYRQVSAMDRTKGRFLQTISHELRTPANGFFGATELLLSEGDGFDPEIVELLDESRKRLTKLIDEASALVELRTENRDQPENESGLSNLIEQIAAESRSASSVHIDPSLGNRKFRVNEDFFRLALVKLLEVAACFAAPEAVRLRANATVEQIVIGIEIEGATLHQSLQDRFFEDFAIEESDVPNGSIGLGPTVAYEAVRGMGGNLELNQPGESILQFVMRLPSTLKGENPRIGPEIPAAENVSLTS